jgi:hypothetical protein
MHIPFDVLERMPVRDRKYYIMRHNKEVEEEKQTMNHQGTVDETNQHLYMPR